MGAIELEGVEKVYAGGVHAVRGLHLSIAEGELLVLLGPSGCGKTTVLRLVAGLESLTGGEIRVGGRRVDRHAAGEAGRGDDLPELRALPSHDGPQEPRVPAPHAGHVRRTSALAAIQHVAGLLSLEPLLDALPGELSGGQQQRVAIGRALVREPAAFLMDEPLSNLDAQLRSRIRTDLAELQRRLAITTLFVTHDQTEAMTLGDRVAVMREGSLQQVGTPDELYGSPANVFVAWFVGSPSMNLLRGRAAAADGASVVSLVGDAGASIRVPAAPGRRRRRDRRLASRGSGPRRSGARRPAPERLGAAGWSHSGRSGWSTSRPGSPPPRPKGTTDRARSWSARPPAARRHVPVKP